MCKIGKTSGFKGFYCLAAVPFQPYRIIRRFRRKAIMDLIAQKMLPQKKILDRILSDNLHQFSKISRIILHFQPQMNLDIVFIFLFQAQNGIYIPLQLVQTHLGWTSVAIRIWHRCMIRKSQNFQSALYCIFNIFPFFPLRMHAAPGVCMVICYHPSVLTFFHYICQIINLSAFCHHLFSNLHYHWKYAPGLPRMRRKAH